MYSIGLGLSFGLFDVDEDVCDLPDWQLPVNFNKNRHKETIEGSKAITHTWRMKERMKTVSVALVLCLNVGVDPPDVVKTQPCARLECWIDPLSTSPQKALEAIGANLQKQYERWQPRARYKQSLDPTVEEVKKLCTSLRRNAKDERVLFHYNGHGVPKPTVNGEIWVFNRSYTQYIPLSVYDLQQWMGAPSIYVYDCSCAGLIVESFRQFALQHEREYEMASTSNKTQYPCPAPPPSYKHCIQLAACGPHQFLPMNPDLPADLFTSCLTTPIKVALKWFIKDNTSKLVPGITLDLIDKIPGQLNDRRTMLGELNWVFTAITDTIAWNILPKELFQKLFRQDLLVASLFRNFLLAERIMRSYDCNPVSSPKLPSTYQHPMWQAWDLAVDTCLSQLPAILKGEATFRHSPFFAEQLTAFQVWLTFGSEEHGPPEQLPIVLQVLLSQVHRLRALELLGRFLDLGPWAVNLALSVGIFPYVLKLLQSSARELRPLLVFIWAKVLAVDSTCQADLVRDGGHKYFLNVLSDPYIPAEHRTMAAFVMACITHNYPTGQEAALQGNVISICLEQLNDSNSLLRQWLTLCLGRAWANYDAARWCGVRDSAHEKLYSLLSDASPEVRASAVYALGTFINSATERTDHANTMDHSIGMTLINKVAQDGSPLVRKELVVSLQWLVLLFETQFVAVASQFMEEEKLRDSIQSTSSHHHHHSNQEFLSIGGGMRKAVSKDKLGRIVPSSSPSNTGTLELSMAAELSPLTDRMRRVASNTSLSSLNSPPTISLGYASVYTHIWKAILTLSTDPHPEVASKAKVVIKHIKCKLVPFVNGADLPRNAKVPSVSEPSSPSGKPGFPMSESPPANMLGSRFNDNHQPFQQYQYSAQFTRTRKIFDKGPSISEEEGEQPVHKSALVTTEFVDWCCNYFSQPVIKFPEEADPESPCHQEREWKYMRNAWIRRGVPEEKKRIELGRLDDQVFTNRNPSNPSVLRFHPYETSLIVADKEGYSLWDWEQNSMLTHQNTQNNPSTRITSIEFINPQDFTLLMMGTDEGSVKVWRNYTGEESKPLDLVTAFQALSDMTPSAKGSGLVLQWEQYSCQLAAAGDVRTIRLWDLEKECQIQDLPTGAEGCVSCLSSSPDLPRMLVAGCSDGSLRLFDTRIPPNECRVTTMREHSVWVVAVSLQSLGDGVGRIYSGSIGGDLKFWDMRQANSLQTVQTLQGMTAMAVHPNIDIIACGFANHCISVYNMNGDTVNIIKYHDGFMGQRIGPISCLAFHPYRANLATGSTDSFISVYGIDRRH